MKRYVRNTINLSCAKILLTSVISVQLAQNCKRMTGSHASPLRNKFSAAIVRCQKLLNTEGVSLKI